MVTLLTVNASGEVAHFGFPQADALLAAWAVCAPDDAGKWTRQQLVTSYKEHLRARPPVRQPSLRVGWH